MKKNQVLIFIIIIFPSLIFAQRIESKKIYSNTFKQEREIIVYTPWEYDNVPDQKFEVVYVFDAQARECFDYVHSSLNFLNNFQFPMIVVGIISEDRNKDFLPQNIQHETYKKYGGHLGGADKFAKFINSELFPYIENNYRTLPKRIAIGHSNGATFITYCLLSNYNLFNDYISISPNWAYDNEQLVDMLKVFSADQLNSKVFYYMCNSNEAEDWIHARTEAISILESDKFENKVVFINQDFSATENHKTVFTIGVLNGLKEYLNYQFFNASNLIAYYSELYSKGQIHFTADIINQIAYDFFFNDKVEEATEILLWANQLFPEDLNLYDSIGEMYQEQDNKPEAMKFYKLFEQKLEQQKDLLSQSEYNELKKGIEERIKNLNDL